MTLKQVKCWENTFFTIRISQHRSACLSPQKRRLGGCLIASEFLPVAYFAVTADGDEG